VKTIADKVEEIKVGSHLSLLLSHSSNALQNDPAIPIRSSKKTGAKSKKEVREQVMSVSEMKSVKLTSTLRSYKQKPASS
jgi:hypothetical protein